MNKPYLLESAENILSFPFKSPGWQSKFAIGVALVFANYIVPILPSIFLAGYTAKIMRDVIVDNAEPTLPEWDDWKPMFVRGLKVSGASLVYMLPALACMIVGYIIMFAPTFMLSMNESRYGDMSGGLAGLMVLGMFGGMGLFFFGYLLLIPLSLLLPPALTHLVATDSFMAAFRIWEWWPILRANFKGFFTALAITSGVYLILFMVVYAFYFTIILCFLMPIGISILIPYLSLVASVMFGEAYRKGVENLAAAAEA